MTRALTDLALSFLRDKERLRASLEHPVLLWNAPPLGELDENWQGTAPGVDGAARARGTEALVIEVTKDAGKRNAFTMWITVGRNDNNDIVLDDASVSRFHASIQHEAGALVLRDAESKNGTFCDGNQVVPSQKTVIHDKSKLKFGAVELTFLSAQSLFALLEQMVGAEPDVQPDAGAPSARGWNHAGPTRPTIECEPAVPPARPPRPK